MVAASGGEPVATIVLDVAGSAVQTNYLVANPKSCPV
jgi:hypothetical protein